MNIINIKASNPKVDNANKNETPFSEFKKGQRMDGLISNVSEKISINFNGTEVSVPESAVQNAKEGEIRTFEIMDVSNKSIVLKEVLKNTEQQKGVQAVFTNVETMKTSLEEHLKQASEEKQKEEEAKEAKDKLSDAAGRITEEDCKGFADEGISLEEYELELLDKAIDRIKTESIKKDEALKNQVDKQKESNEQIKETISLQSGHSSEDTKQIVEKLQDADMPITQENVQKFVEIVELAQTLPDISEKAQKYLLKNQLEASPKNLYKASYIGGTDNDVNKLDEKSWEQLKPQAEQIIEEAGLTINDKNLDSSRWILENNIPLTKDSIDALNNLEKLKEGITKEQIIDRLSNGLKKGTPIEEIAITDDSLEVSRQTVEAFNSISDQAVEEVSKSGKTINLKNLKETQIILEKNISNINYKNGEIKDVTALRQLEEIRLKMTAEAAQRLIGKGIKLDTTSLKDIVEGLKQIEDDYYKNVLKEGKAVASDANINVLRETEYKVNELKNAPNYILADTLASKNIQTIDSLYLKGDKLKEQLQKALTSYETLMTEPRKDLGDSISKAFKNIDNILNEMNLEPTKANERAVKILGYNNMAITEESINEIKAYDLQMNELLDNLHPAAVVDLIKQGINPLNTPIDELSSDLKKVKQKLGVTEEEKYSKYLWKLEKEDGITKEERKSYIGIYRLLNNVGKTDGAALGSVINANKEITLNNLLTAVKTMKKNGVDVSLDENFGELESINYQRENIISQVEASFNEKDSKKKSYNESLLEKIKEEIEPEKLKTIGLVEDIMNYSVEKLSETLERTKKDIKKENGYYKEQAESIRELAKDCEDAIRLLKDLEMPDTINTTRMAKEFLSTDNNISKKLQKELETLKDNEKEDLKEVLEGFNDSCEDDKTMQSQYEKLDEAVNKILNKQYENNTITAKDLANLKMLNGSMNFVKAASNKENYQIPLLVGESITNVNLTILHGTKNSGKVHMEIESEELGDIAVDISVKEGNAKGFISCESSKTLDFIEKELTSIKDSLKTVALDLTQMDFSLNKKVSTSYKMNNTGNAEKEPATTKQLYQTAKVILVAVRDIEIKNR